MQGWSEGWRASDGSESELARTEGHARASCCPGPAGMHLGLIQPPSAGALVSKEQSISADRPGDWEEGAQLVRSHLPG